MPIPNKPITRKETYLAAIAGQEVTLPAKPITREEAYLDEIAKNGKGASYEILDSYDTLEELETAHPTGKAGDAYLVGDPSHVYVWLTESEEWGDGGEFTAVEGPKGDKGDKGDPGQDGASLWGEINGTLSNQTDLQDALDAKASMNDVVSYITNTVLGGSD